MAPETRGNAGRPNCEASGQLAGSAQALGPIHRRLALALGVPVKFMLSVVARLGRYGCPVENCAVKNSIQFCNGRRISLFSGSQAFGILQFGVMVRIWSRL